MAEEALVAIQQTYGDGTGWSAAERSAGTPPAASVPRPEPEPGTIPEAAPVVAPSPEPEPPAPETTPPLPSQPVSTDVPFHQHPRWIERQRELEDARRRADQAEHLARLALERSQLPQAPVAQPDPWEGKVNHPDATTAQYWQEMRRLVQYERQQAKQEAVQELMPVIDAGRQELARISVQEFRRQNPDIKPGSEEERLVAAYMNGQIDNVRHPIESARRNALYDRLEAENRALKSKQSSVSQKRAAAHTDSSAGIPQTAGLPQTKASAEEAAGEVLSQGGNAVQAAAAFFGIRR